MEEHAEGAAEDKEEKQVQIEDLDNAIEVNDHKSEAKERQ